MQTPLITNFSRGILSPKFYGRVETELYAAGAADLLNFIVNAQGSAQRRIGTYRIWDTRLTLPRGVSEDDDRFEVQFSEGTEYTLVCISNPGNSAQLILSTNAGVHRYFEIERPENQFEGLNTYQITQVRDDPDELTSDLQALAFNANLQEMVDDAFITKYYGLTFLRKRLARGGYGVRFWESVESLEKIKAGQNPFVSPKPLSPPDYSRESPILDQRIGYRIGTEEVVTALRKVVQFVGQIVRGESRDLILIRGRLRGQGSSSNATQLALATAPIELQKTGGAFKLGLDQTITYTITTAFTQTNENGSTTTVFSSDTRNYEYFKYIDQREVYIYSGGAKRVIQERHITPNPGSLEISISFTALREILGVNWRHLITGTTKIFVKYVVQYTERRRKRGRLFARETVTRTKTLDVAYALLSGVRPAVDAVTAQPGRPGHSAIALRAAGPNEGLTEGLNIYNTKEYEPIEPVLFNGTENDYRLRYVTNGVRPEIARTITVNNTAIPIWEITVNSAGTHIEKVTINEASINPSTNTIPDANAHYIIERDPITADAQVVGERLIPWEKGEDLITDVFRYIGEYNEDAGENDFNVFDPFPEEIIDNAAAAFIHSNRLMLISSNDDDKSPTIVASTINDLLNFYQGTSATDSYTISFDTDIEETIMWVVSMREGVVVGTTRNEYIITGAASSNTVQVQRYTSNGSALPYAFRFGDKIIYASRDARKLYGYQYSDELSAWFSNDITSFAEHLFRRKIKSFKYMSDPFHAVFVIPEGNEGLLALTWEPDTAVMAWTRHFEGVNVLAMEVVTIDARTLLLLAVNRNDSVVIEALDFSDDPKDVDAQIYADSAEYLVFEKRINENTQDEEIIGPDGQATQTNYVIDFSSLRWARFQNQDTVVMVNGETERVLQGPTQPHETKVITVGPFEGADIPIELETEDGEGEIVIVGIGLPYVSRLQTLPIIVQSPSGAGIFKDTQVQKIRVRIDDSGAFKAGNSLEDLTDVEVADDEDVVEDPISGYYTGDIEVNIQSRWMKRPQVVIESYFADPLTVLAIMADAQVFE